MGARLVALVGACALAGCSYDWSVADGGTVDAAVESPAPPVDAGTDTEGASPLPDGSTADVAADVPVESSVNCSALEAQVQSDRAAAIACDGSTSACMATVQNECDCPVVVGSSSTVATQDYEEALAQLKAANCTLACAPSCGQPPQKGLCIVGDAGAGALACSQL